MESQPAWRGYGKALALIALDRQQEASDILGDYIEMYQDECAYQIASIYAYKGDKDEAFSWLYRAFDQRDGGWANHVKTNFSLHYITIRAGRFSWKKSACPMPRWQPSLTTTTTVNSPVF